MAGAVPRHRRGRGRRDPGRSPARARRDVGDGFLAALPRAVAWAAVVGGCGDDDRPTGGRETPPIAGAEGRRRRRPRVDPRAAGGLAWFAADATTAQIVPGAPALAMVLTIAALFAAGARAVGARRRPLALRRGRQRRPADRHVRCRRRARRSRRGPRAARRHGAAGAAPALGPGIDGRSSSPSSRSPASAADQTPDRGRQLRADGGRRAARAARVRTEARRPAQRPRPPAARRTQSRGGAAPAHA